VSEKVFLIRCATNTFRWRKWDSGAFDSPQFWAWAGNLDLIESQVIGVNHATRTRKDLCTLAQLATWNMHAGIVKQLLSRYPELIFSVELNGDHNSVFSMAAETGDVMVLRLLHQKVGRRLFGSSPPDFNTCMHFAAKFGHVDVVKMLNRETGLGTEDKNRVGQTPMHWAARCGHSPVIEVLCNLGANHSARDHNRSVPVHYAAKYGKLEGMKMLISKGASVKISNKLKQTPLHFAVTSSKQNVVEVLEVLRGAGADVGAEDKQKRTPFDWAVSLRNNAAIEFFKREWISRGSNEGPSRDITANKYDDEISTLMRQIEDALQLKEL
jgi:ankyrin repeat protein